MGHINVGLTSVLQVADLVANKPVKALIKAGYYKWRRDYIQQERANVPNQPNRCAQLKMPVVAITNIIEEAIKKFNDEQKKQCEGLISKAGSRSTEGL